DLAGVIGDVVAGLPALFAETNGRVQEAGAQRLDLFRWKPAWQQRQRDHAELLDPRPGRFRAYWCLIVRESAQRFVVTVFTRSNEQFGCGPEKFIIEITVAVHAATFEIRDEIHLGISLGRSVGARCGLKAAGGEGFVDR